MIERSYREHSPLHAQHLIDPRLVEFDGRNEILSYEFDMSTGVPDFDKRLHEEWIFEAFAKAADYLRKEKQIPKLVERIGKVAVVGSKGSEYNALLSEVISEPSHPDARTALDQVIDRFSPHIENYRRLYVPKTAKKTTPKKIKPSITPETLGAEVPEGLEVADTKVLRKKLNEIELTPSAEAVMRHLIRSGSIRLEELKKNRALMKHFARGDEGYRQLRAALPELEQEIVILLAERQYEARWISAGYGRAARHFLLTPVTGELKKPEPARIEPPKPATPQPRQEEVRRLALIEQAQEKRNFEQRLARAEIVANRIIAAATISPKASDVAKQLSDDRTEGRALINELLSRGRLHRGEPREGHATLSKERVEKAGKTKKPEPAKAEQEIVPLSDEEKRLAAQAFAFIGTARARELGQKYQSVIDELGKPVAESRALFVKLADRGLLVRMTRMIKGRGHGRSERQALFLTFPTQEDWLQYKKDPEAYLARLEDEE